jgi:uncharacterized repeat protein (TIGR03803 family)
MARLNLSRDTLSVSIAAALLAACGGSQPPIGVPGAMPQVSALGARSDGKDYKVVYSFSGGSDGASPFAGLIDVDGKLYGTTIAGGAYSCTYLAYYGCGTVYSVTLTGTENVLHNFGAGSDGSNPRASLVDVHGTLYGTTSAGGSYGCYGSYYSNCGTVFSITPSGTEQVLHSFSGYPVDGALPYASLVDVNGILYGTTDLGGRGECYYSGDACGTVFSITTSGSEKVLHGFTGSPDGGFSSASLIDVKGTLYGTTGWGGKHGYGTVFSITTAGAEKVLHNFGAGTDGRFPSAGLIELRGKLYGTTSAGGVYRCGSRGTCGTVFSITPNGTEKVLHSFGHGSDGTLPQASLIKLDGTLYGTTLSGGAGDCGSDCDYGTVFSITPDGGEKILHKFGASGYANDGASPYASLIDVHRTLFGTTVKGGANGYGTVFALTP